MKYIDFCGKSLSQIVLGTDGYSQRTDKDNAFEMLDFYVESGGNVIDTARSYCDGGSERLIGEYLKERKLRDKIFLSTKCSFPDASDMHASRLTPCEIESDIDKSLISLGVDTIDMLWLHRDDEKKSVQSLIDTLNNMVKKGKIQNFGASNWIYERIDSANRYAYESGLDGFSASQILYNMATPKKVWDDTLVMMDEEEKKKYRENNFPVFAFSSQAKGFFEKYNEGILSPKAKDRYFCEKSVKTYARIKETADKNGDTISYTALKMLCDESGFDVFPIIGPANLSQLKSSLNVK